MNGLAVAHQKIGRHTTRYKEKSPNGKMARERERAAAFQKFIFHLLLRVYGSHIICLFSTTSKALR